MRDRHLLIATYNQGKLDELRNLLRCLPFELHDLNSLSSIEPVAETGNTFIENATLKAVGYAKQTALMTLADDSGLEVTALGGEPGVRSARYAGDQATDAERVNMLLLALSETKEVERLARFVSAIAIADYHGTVLNVCVGICQGRIAHRPRGSNGFGYDPIFIADGTEKTFAELSADAKSQISHRAIALRGTTEFLSSLTGHSRGG